MLKVICRKNGSPDEALEVVEESIPEPNGDEVVVKMLAASVNPADLAAIRAAYRIPIQCPGTPGFEGMGVVIAIGKDVKIFCEGDSVIYIPLHIRNKELRNGTWTEFLCAREIDFFPVPRDLEPMQGAQLINSLVTPLLMLTQFLQIKKNDYLLMTAAGSTVGRVVIKMSNIFGFKVIGIVRRPEQVDELKQIGAAEIICSANEDVFKKVMSFTSLAGVPCVLDSVGGDMFEVCARCLSDNGRIVNFGLLDLNKDASIDLRRLLYYQQRVYGFWVTSWFNSSTKAQWADIISHVISLIFAHSITADVERTYTLTDIKPAMNHLSAAGNKGKIIIKF